MRLLDFGEQADYQPLDRGEAFPQYYQDGDKCTWQNPMHWNYKFWQMLLCESIHHPTSPGAGQDAASMMLMGGEL